MGSLLNSGGTRRQRRLQLWGQQCPPLAALQAASLAVALLACLLPACVAVEDTVVLHSLRSALRNAEPEWVANQRGWQSDSQDHHCAWEGVTCNKQRRVTAITLQNYGQGSHRVDESAPAANATTPLLPKLAQLQWLQELVLLRYSPVPWQGIPSEWLVPGAFPQLHRLSITGNHMTAPLPDIPPGALPRLEQLEFDIHGLRTTLPASWGADPAVLPALERLTVQVQLEGSLPAQWARGFQQLAHLDVLSMPDGMADSTMQVQSSSQHDAFVEAAAAWRSAARGSQGRSTGGGRSSSTSPGAVPTLRLPADWAAGFPKLQTLFLGNLPISGSLPQSWQDGGFPMLHHLSFEFLDLTGTLPPHLFERHPKLTSLHVWGTRISGTLPSAWASSQLQILSLETNSLSGPAFPAGWIQPGAMPGLIYINLAGNPRLTGTLPANLSWPKLAELKLSGTGLGGTVPDAWCRAPFALRLRTLMLEETAIRPGFPPCMTFYNLGRSSWMLHSALTPPPASASATKGLSFLQPFAVLAAAAAAICGLRRTKRFQSKAGGGSEPRHALQGLRHASASPSAWKEQPVDGRQGDWARTRRERLAAVLSPGLGTCGTAVQLHTLGGRTAALAHQLRSADPLVTSGSRHLPCIHFEEAGKEAATAGAMSSTAAIGAQSLGQPWGMGTTSLQLRAEELQFMVDEEGSLIVLGEGSFGITYLARLSGVLVAVKVFELQADMNPHAIWKEAVLLRQCVHERVVPLFGVVLKSELLMMAMEHMEGGTLRAALICPNTREKLRWEAKGRQVAMDVAEGLVYLHTVIKVMHGDLKPSNVLLRRDLRACLGDLGTAQVVSTRARTSPGFTPTHAAPEQLLGARCCMPADIYSLGVLLVELTTLRPMGRRGEWDLPRVPEDCSQAVRSLVQDCLSPYPAHRPSAAQVLQRLQAAASSASGALP